MADQANAERPRSMRPFILEPLGMLCGRSPNGGHRPHINDRVTWTTSRSPASAIATPARIRDSQSPAASACEGAIRSAGRGLRALARLSGPAKFPHGPAGVPDLAHVTDLAVLELHHVDIVAAGALAGWGHRAALAGVRAREHGVDGDVIALVVRGEGFDRVASVGDDHKQPLHPLGVLLQRLHVGERFRLSREARVWLTVGAAFRPALPVSQASKKARAVSV